MKRCDFCDSPSYNVIVGPDGSDVRLCREHDREHDEELARDEAEHEAK